MPCLYGPVSANIDGTTTDRSAVRRACEAYSAIDYEMDDEIGDSVVCLGVIGAPSDVVKRAQAVNAAKGELKALFAPPAARPDSIPRERFANQSDSGAARHLAPHPTQ